MAGIRHRVLRLLHCSGVPRAVLPERSDLKSSTLEYKTPEAVSPAAGRRSPMVNNPKFLTPK